MKRILITGGSGFVGRHVLPGLLRRAYEVHATTIDTNPPDLDENICWHHVDLLDPQLVQDLVCCVRPSHLLHLAWVTEPGTFWSSEANYDWLQSSIALFRSFANQGGTRALLVGTCAEYDARYGVCTEELTPLNPSTTYGICKQALSIVVGQIAEEHGVSSAWGRLFSLYGPHEPKEKLVSYVISTLLQGREAKCTAGLQIRDFLHVADVAGALESLLDSDLSGPVNIASGVPVRLKDLICRIADLLGRADLLRLGARPAAVHEPQVLLAEVSRLRNGVNWQPRYDLETGLVETIAWHKGHMNRTVN